MLVSFAAGPYDQDRRHLLHELASGAAAFLLACISIILDMDALYVGTMLCYVMILICKRSENQRIRKLLLTIFLAMVAYFPLNTITAVISISTSYNLLEHDPVISVMGALADCVLIFSIYLYRKKQDDRAAIHFTVMEYSSAIFIFFFTAISAAVLDPSAGITSSSILDPAPVRLLLSMFAVSITFINLFFLVMLWRSKTSEYYKELHRSNTQYIERELEYFETYKHAQTDIRKFRHDMKHHISRMQQLCSDADITAVKEYLHTLQDQWAETAEILYQTGDTNVDAILNAKVQQMRRENIGFSLSGAFTGKLSLSPFDLCAVFSNALDNAIEANRSIMDAGRKSISLSIRKSHAFYIITIENPLGSRPLPDFKTTKQDRTDHGFGLVSIKEKVRKNGGSVTIHADDRRFLLEIFLPI